MTSTQMATTDTEKYSRLAFTLQKGGTEISRALFVKCLRNLKGKDETLTVDAFLLENKEKILSVPTGKGKERILFPALGGSDIEKWDLYLLCFILLSVVQLPSVVRRDVEELLKMRNKLCHLPKPALSDADYASMNTKLEVIFDRCLKEVDDDKLTKEINGIQNGPLALDDLVNQMHTFYRMEIQQNEIIGQQKVILDRHSKDHDSTRESLKQHDEKLDRVLEELQTISSRLPADSEVDVPGVGVVIEVRNCNAEMENRIVRVLVKIFNDIIDNKDSSVIEDLSNDAVHRIRDAVEQTFKKFLSAGKHIINVKQKCVMLTIKCDTIPSFAGLMSDYNSSEINQQLQAIQTAIQTMKGCEAATIEVIIYKDEFWKVLEELVEALKVTAQQRESCLSPERRTLISSDELLPDLDETESTDRLSITIQSDYLSDTAQSHPLFKTEQIEHGMIHLQKEIEREFKAPCVQLIARPTIVKSASQEEMHGQSSTAEEITTCKSCSFSEKPLAASKYCLSCDLHLCDNCTKQHNSNASTKFHKPLPMHKKEDIIKPCSSCEDPMAIKYCETCDECLCSSCVSLHKQRTAFKNHKPFDIGYMPYSCQPKCCVCLLQGKNESAIRYCQTCDERLCSKCTDRHGKNKVTTSHMLDYIRAEIKDVKTFNNDEKEGFCDLCFKVKEERVVARMVCEICREKLCEKCTRIHKNQTATGNHLLLDIKRVEGQITYIKHKKTDKTFVAEVQCQRCKNLKGTEKAKCSCLQCREQHASYYRFHGTHRESPDHRVSADLSKSTDALRGKASLDEQSVVSFKEKDVPGKPSIFNVKSDSVALMWGCPRFFDDSNDYYQVSYKEMNKIRWTIFPDKLSKPTVEIKGLKSSTEYVFRVRVVRPDGEGHYSLESPTVITLKNPVANLIEKSRVSIQGNPSPTIYTLPIREDRNARNDVHKTKKFEIGDEKNYAEKEKTIMFVGETGTGKSTFVDGLLNYVLAVNWNDEFRCSIVHLEEEERARKDNQTVSQTEWVTVYTIYPEEGSRIGFKLNIIDTPGFGDTRGLERDQQVVDQIHALFSESGTKGVTCIDAICFLIKAPDARLTTSQKYIFQSIMALFGNDIETNICSIITFADSCDPPVLAALKVTGLPFGKHFTFNNAGLFAKNVDLEENALLPQLWDMGLKSFSAFFQHLEKMDTRNLKLTKQVLDERKILESTVENLEQRVDVGLSKLSMLKDEILIIEQHKLDAEANRDFKYEIEEIKQQRHELPKGKYATNCPSCIFTCHANCMYENDDDKRNCFAMDKDGNCTRCRDKCHWKTHNSTSYIYKYEVTKKERTYEDKLRKFESAEGKRMKHEQVVDKLQEELDKLQKDIEDLIADITSCNERLAETALQQNPLSIIDQIDLMIQTEIMGKNPRYNDRIAALNKMKNKALMTNKAKDLTQQVKQHSIPKRHESVSGQAEKEPINSHPSDAGFWQRMLSCSIL